MWTNEQLAAIKNTGGTLLVSAAAGSGKTAVLVERIIQKIITQKISIDKFLVVTFTNKAAAEMAEKIEIAISKEVLKNPKNQFLRNQLSLINKAQITTVHSFCFNLIRENFTFLNLSPDFKIAGDLDIQILKKQCMSKVLNENFKNIEQNQNFQMLVDTIGEHILDIEMIKIYDFLQSHAEPIKYLEKSLENYKNAQEFGFETTFWYNEIVQNTIELLHECIQNITQAIALCNNCDILFEKNHDLLQNELESYKDILNTVEDIDLTLKKVKNLAFPTWKSVKKSTDETSVLLAKKLRDQAKTTIREKMLNTQTLEQIQADIDQSLCKINAIHQIICQFDKLFSEQKLKKNILDFNDAEHMALKIVSEIVDGNLQKSTLGYEISKKFSEIMVDEYQDTNEIQDILFRLLSNDEKNIFMVGDIKQSIYKFRLADPLIFREKYMNFQDADQVLDNSSRKIVLSRNFRSRNAILDSTNYIFENIMNFNTGQVDYDQNQKLYFGADYYENPDKASEFMLIDYDNIAENKEKNTNEVEAIAICNEIKKLIDSEQKIYDKELKILRNITPNDIVILLRSTSTKAYFYKSELEKSGFSVDFKEGTEKLLGSPEIRNLISIFKVIDNYLIDSDLLGVMRSPIFGFNDNHIAKIRDKKQSLYQNILDFAENGDEICQKFLDDLKNIEEFAKNNTIFKTLWYIIDKMYVLPIFLKMEHGKKRYENILRFANFVETLDESYTIYDFVTFIDEIDSKKVKLPASISSNQNIKIMTIHASKGLEFPIVFLADTAKEFNKLDLRTPITLHNKFGVALKCIDDENIVRYPSIMQKILKNSIENELLAEEMRILYVAMTRPKEKLYVMCTLKKAVNVFQKWVDFEFSDKNILQSKSYHNFFGPNIVKLPCSNVFYEKFNCLENSKINGDLPNYFNCTYIDSLQYKIYEKEQIKHKNSDITYKKFEYQHNEESKIPSKITATSVKEEKISIDFEEEIRLSKRKPVFLKDNTITGAERGIAHHIVMQFIDFKKCKSIHEINEQLKILCEKEIISKIQFEAIDPYKILAFTMSDVYSKMEKSNKIIREFKFSVLQDAKKFYNVSTDDKVLLQGVVDCMFFEDDGITIIDYKTDNINENNIKMISENYAYQVEVYANAMSEIFNMPVKQKLLYYFKNDSFYDIS